MTAEERPMLVNKLVERGTEIRRLREALQNIAIGGIGETNWSNLRNARLCRGCVEP